MSDQVVPVFLARQPIVDRGTVVYGYELLYRRGLNGGPGEMSDADSARSIANALIEIGLNELVGKTKAFINVDEPMIVSGVLDALPPARVVLEILETVQATERVLAEIKRLRKRGYVFALDDYVANASTQAMLPLVDLVKVDITQYSEAELVDTVGSLGGYPCRLLAERVETPEEQRTCSELGFDLFQGYFFAKPEVMEGRALKTNQLALVRLLARMNAPDLTLDELESIVVSEVQLNLRLLKFMKSAYFGLPEKVDSIRKMLLFVGVRTLAAVATVLMLSELSGKPSELIHLAMVRAKVCEMVGRSLGCSDVDRFFTTGMLSLLDAMLDLPMQDVLRQLPLTEELETVLLRPNRESDLAKALRIAMFYEAGDFEAIHEEGFDLSDADRIYRAANAWANQTQAAIAA